MPITVDLFGIKRDQAQWAVFEQEGDEQLVPGESLCGYRSFHLLTSRRGWIRCPCVDGISSRELLLLFPWTAPTSFRSASWHETTPNLVFCHNAKRYVDPQSDWKGPRGSQPAQRWSFLHQQFHVLAPMVFPGDLLSPLRPKEASSTRTCN